METSKIRAKATYHKCINELQEFGYIIYKPSFNPYRGTEIFFNYNASDKERVNQKNEPPS
jgi:hypothetical protein